MLKRAWLGEERLWKVWWLIGVPTELGCIAALAASYLLTGNLIVPIYGLIVAIPVVLASWRMEWVCAPNVNHRVWMYVVRSLIVLRIAEPLVSYALATLRN
jgi:phosphoglycerol transferase MdoB-like AlkP superfamily enzyme